MPAKRDDLATWRDGLEDWEREAILQWLVRDQNSVARTAMSALKKLKASQCYVGKAMPGSTHRHWCVVHRSASSAQFGPCKAVLDFRALEADAEAKKERSAQRWEELEQYRAEYREVLADIGFDKAGDE